MQATAFAGAMTAKLKWKRRYGILLACVVSVGVASAVVAAQNVALSRFFPHLTRLTPDFSPAYLRRELDYVASAPPATIFLGDSVLWGYHLNAGQTAISILASEGCFCRNFAFNSGNPPNYYALARLFLASRIHPRAVVIEVNQSVLNASDSWYQTLHPGIAALAASQLSQGDRELLTMPKPGSGQAQWTDRMISSFSLLYAMRSDIREALFGEVAEAHVARLTPDLFEATYDLVPLSGRNVGVHFLEKTVASLRAAGVPTIAFFTPTNHGLLHEYIDNSHYRANAAFLAAVLEARGARIVDLDDALPQNAFIDNAHLNEEGNRRLAALLSQELRKLVALPRPQTSR